MAHALQNTFNALDTFSLWN